MRTSEEGEGSFSAHDLALDARFAVRNLRRTPGFTLVSVLTLALGIGATTAVFSVLNQAIRRPLPFPHPEELVLGRGIKDGDLGWVSGPNCFDYRDRSHTLASLALIGLGTSSVTVTGGDEPGQARAMNATGNLFETLGVAPLLGRTSSLDELPAGGGGEVVISYGFWQRWFGGSPDVLGRSLTVDGRSLTVVGVMPAGFRFRYDADLWLPPWVGNRDPSTRRYNNWLVLGRLAPGVTLDAARSEMEVISAGLREEYPDVNQGRGLQLDDLHAAMVEGYEPSLFLLVGAIALVLLIACGNVANLLLARGSTRTSELAVRAALGADRGRLTRQLLVECSILALIAGGLGVVLAIWIQNAILRFVSMDLLGVTDLGISRAMLGIALALSGGTVLLFGLFPSVTAARTDPASELRKGGRTSTSGRGVHFRSGLVVAQVALSMVLLVGSGLLIRSLRSLVDVDPGFRAENLLTASIVLPTQEYPGAEQQRLFFEELYDEVQSLPGVASVGLVSRLPILQRYGDSYIWDPDRPPETTGAAPTADQRFALPGYFKTMGIPLVEGRPIESTDKPDSPPVVVVNRATAEAIFPGQDAVGRQVVIDMGWERRSLFQVVGVVENHVLSSLSGSPRMAVFFPFAQEPKRMMRLAVRASVDPLSLVRPIQERIWSLDRNIVLSDPQTMEHVLSDSVSGARSITTVLGLFATVALGLAILGLYGVLTFFVNQRFREIGIRVALGASRRRVLRLVVTRGMVLVGTGAVLGLAGSLGATRLLGSMLFQVGVTDPATYVGAAALFLAVGLGACALPAWRALGVDPIETLKIE